MEIDAWIGLGDSWECLGSHLGSQGRPSRTEKRNQMTNKWTRPGFHVGVHFRLVPFFFDVFVRSFLVSIFMATKTEFSKIFISFLNHFYKLFSQVSGLTANKENVILI